MIVILHNFNQFIIIFFIYLEILQQLKIRQQFINCQKQAQQKHMNSNLKPNYIVCIQDKKACRQEQVFYCEQIFQQYINNQGQQHLIRRMFQTLHSDWLNLQESLIEFNHHQIHVLRSKTKIQQGDILMDIRGSVINRKKLNKLVQDNPDIKNLVSQVNCLLWGQKDIDVLVPKGLSKVLMSNTANYVNFLENNQQNKNCFIEYELGAKYLISASKQIQPGQILVLDLDSIKRHQYGNQSL